MLNNYGNFGQLGSQLAGQSYDMGVGNLGLANQAGQTQQAYAQSLIDAQREKWDWNQNAPWNDQANRQALTQSWAVGNPYTDAGMSPFEGIAQGALTGLGAFGAGQDAGWWGSGSPTNTVFNPRSVDQRPWAYSDDANNPYSSANGYRL